MQESTPNAVDANRISDRTPDERDDTVTSTTSISPSTPASMVTQALLQKQFFPNVKQNREELPPYFASDSFTRDMAAKLSRCQPKFSPGTIFRTRRFDGLVRHMGICHPVPYAKLVLHIEANWSALDAKLNSNQSMIQPKLSHSDGRVIIMDYETAGPKILREIRSAQGMRYHVSADIANFFPSIYAHSIDWALRGSVAAKAGIKDKSWEAKLDQYVENCHNAETKGIMIGPAVSNIISEIILQRIDENMTRKKLGNYVRYVDDYSAYFNTREEAEHFVYELDKELSSFRLQLNSRKTAIETLGSNPSEGWMGELTRALPRRGKAVDGVQYLRHCETLALQHPAKSILVYGIVSLLNHLACPPLNGGLQKSGRRWTKAKRKSNLVILEELLRITYFHPHLTSLSARYLNWCMPFLTDSEKSSISDLVRKIAMEACRRRETDVCLWGLYIVRNQLRRRFSASEFNALATTQDDLILLACAITSKIGRRRATEYAKALNNASQTDIKEHWLLRYELYRASELTDNDLDQQVETPWFKMSRQQGLKFSHLAKKQK